NEKSNDGFVGESSEMEMILEDAHGTKIKRRMKGKIMETKGDGDKSISQFLLPADVKGTMMLTWTHKKKDDDQWLFLPSIKRTKRISSSNKSASFMGSEFSYEDLGSQEVEKYSHKLLKEEKNKDGLDLWVMERIPRNKKSGYRKLKVWIIKKYSNPGKIEYYDRKNELLKIATFSSFKEFKIGSRTLYRASKIHMVNVQTGKKSTISWSNRSLGVKFDEEDFEKDSLLDQDF
ncbi:MAG: outer membrane lipoprotein-sorting protein, partial [Bdellovibrionota bacterium]|nr:outer membrane lipoprotein-sorting protein [Bdellovibrionota bacterium]